MIAVKKGEYWGYVNEYGEEIIPIEYQWIFDVWHESPYPENGGYVVLKDKTDKFGVMDIYGNVVQDFIYDWGIAI